MILTRMPSIFSNFRAIELAFIVLIAIKLGFNSFTLMEHFRDGNDSVLSFPQTTRVYAQSEAETSPFIGNQKASPINIAILENISKRSEDLDVREGKLDQRKKELNMLQATIDQKLNKMTEVQKKIERLLSNREDLIDRSIKHLVKVYSSMKPNNAAALIEKLDKDISIQILSRMKGKSAAKIFGKMDPGIATDLSDKIAKRK